MEHFRSFPGRAVKLICLASLILACSCLAPLSNSFTGRSLGKGKVGLEGGAIAAGSALPVLKFSVGLSSNLDLGLQYDSFSLGLFGKYSFINNQESGFSLAGVVGGGATVGGGYAYAGPAFSYKIGALEPYVVGRYNFVSYGESSSSSGLSWEAGNHSYFQFTLGGVVWLGKGFGLNAEVSFFSGLLGIEDMVPATVLVGAKIRF
jgi:hypothetical protein